MKSQLTSRRVRLPCDYRLILLTLILNFGYSSYRMRSVLCPCCLITLVCRNGIVVSMYGDHLPDCSWIPQKVSAGSCQLQQMVLSVAHAKTQKVGTICLGPTSLLTWINGTGLNTAYHFCRRVVYSDRRAIRHGHTAVHNTCSRLQYIITVQA